MRRRPSVAPSLSRAPHTHISARVWGRPGAPASKVQTNTRRSTLKTGSLKYTQAAPWARPGPSWRPARPCSRAPLCLPSSSARPCQQLTWTNPIRRARQLAARASSTAPSVVSTAIRLISSRPNLARSPI